jgi:small subunit ribosomal protein S2
MTLEDEQETEGENTNEEPMLQGSQTPDENPERPENETVAVQKDDDSSQIGHAQGEDTDYASETDNLEKMILSTGIRVGTPVRTKYMSPFIVRANPEGLYILGEQTFLRLR